jgi:hypothetical protein
MESEYESSKLHLKHRPELNHPTTTYRMGYIDALQQMFPDLKLSYGYLGNQWTTGPPENRDNRYHYIWCHSEYVRNWCIREERYDGHNPSYWHQSMGYSFGHTKMEDDSFIKAILEGKLMKWAKEMQRMHDEIHNRLQENSDRDWIDMITDLGGEG